MLGLGVPPIGEEIHMGRAPEAEQKPFDLLVEQPFCEKRMVLVGKQVGNDFLPPAGRTTD